jgi:C2 domain.
MAETELLERKEYVVGITILEARAIQGLDSEGTSDPFLKVKCADQVQQTT